MTDVQVRLTRRVIVVKRFVVNRFVVKKFVVKRYSPGVH
jgi:hypothetical protein